MSADKDLISVQQARDLVEAAHKAQAEIARFDQAKIDRICEAMSKAALREAARLGAMAVEETGYGVADDKREKNRFAAEDVWNYFRGLRTVGVVSESKDVVEIASPRGVVAGIIPSTNPNLNRDLQNSDRDQIAKRDCAFAASFGRPVYQRNGASDARSRRQRRIAGRGDRLHDDRDDRGHRSLDEAQADCRDSGDRRHRSGARCLFIRQTGVRRWPRQCSGFHRANGGCSESSAGYSDRQVFRQRNHLRFRAGGGL